MKNKILGMYVCVLLIATPVNIGDLFGVSAFLTRDVNLNGPMATNNEWDSVDVITNNRDNQPPVFGTPDPENNSANNNLSFDWSIPINDPEGDSFNWTIECNNGQNSNGTNEFNGTKSLLLSGLAYATSYEVWVNATDPTGSNLTTKEWYKFLTESEPWVNRAPTFNNPSPVNGSTVVNRFHATNVTVSDLDGNSTTVCFWYSLSNNPYSWIKAQQNNSVVANTTVRDLNSSYSSGWNTPYWWKVTAFDGHTNVSAVYNFTTTSQAWVNRAPTFNNPSPVNGSTVVNRFHATNVTVSDLDGNSTTVCFWYSLSNNPYSWIKAQQNNSVVANTTVRDLNSSYSSGWNTPYWWKVTAFDGHMNVSVVYNFTTAPQSWVNRTPTFSNPSPMNGSSGQPLSLTWGIPINDPDGDLFIWTIQCSNGQNNSGTAANNGTKTLALSSLAYSTVYKVWVNATDPTGSSNYTRKWYTFTTRNVDGYQPPVVPPPGPSNNKPIADASAGEPYQGFVNSEILFNGSKSYDPDGNITNWFWVFGDNTTGIGKTVTHIYSKAGTYSISLTVTDSDKAINIDTTTCIIKQQNRPPAKPTITGPTLGTKNTMYTYTVVSTDADNDTIQYTFNWGESISQSSGFLPNATNYTVNHSWIAAGRYDITVTVTDNLTESSSGITVYIDALQTRGAGYLLDNDGDGTYDAFYSDQYHQTTTIQKKDDSYLIDSNGDGTWDYIYNATKGLTDYREPRNTPGFEIIIILGAIAFVMFWTRKRKDNN